MEEVSSLHWFVGWGVAAVVFACLVLVSAGPSTGWVSSVLAQEPECVCVGGEGGGESMICGTNFPDIVLG